MSIFKNKLPLVAALVALVFTVATSAFTKAGNSPATYPFAYQHSTYDQADVEDLTNWASGSTSCTGDDKACQMTVEESYTHINPLTQQRELNTNSAQGSVLNIQTGTNNSSDYFVEPTTGVTSISNKD